jgi:signal transduction histidine kinase
MTDRVGSNDVNGFSMSDYAVLFVDDEEDVLKALRRVLRTEPYQTYYALSAKEALDLLAHQPIHVLVSDMRMPQISGPELLEKVASQYPEIIRMVISVWADSDSILDAVNTGHIYRYIVKPWDNRELKLTLRQALDMYRLQAERKELIEKLKVHNRDLEKTVVQRTEQIMAVSQQAQIGKYTSKIVDNLNDPLNNLSAAIELIGLLATQADLTKDQLNREVVRAQTEIDRLKKIVANLLGHSASEKSTQLELVNINDAINAELDYFDLDPFFHYEIQKELHLASNLPSIMGNPVQIKQILDHLIKNAVDAMGTTPIKRLTITTNFQADSIEIQVSDSGIGIASEHQESVFLENFTTKPVGEGTGLGLFMVKATVAAYLGSVDFISNPTQGTTFTVRLPVGRTKITSDIYIKH